MLVVKYNSTDTISDEAHLYGLRYIALCIIIIIFCIIG